MLFGRSSDNYDGLMGESSSIFFGLSYLVCFDLETVVSSLWSYKYIKRIVAMMSLIQATITLLLSGLDVWLRFSSATDLKVS